jgi:hypothetical protein
LIPLCSSVVLCDLCSIGSGRAAGFFSIMSTLRAMALDLEPVATQMLSESVPSWLQQCDSCCGFLCAAHRARAQCHFMCARCGVGEHV